MRYSANSCNGRTRRRRISALDIAEQLRWLRPCRVKEDLKRRHDPSARETARRAPSVTQSRLNWIGGARQTTGRRIKPNRCRSSLGSPASRLAPERPRSKSASPGSDTSVFTAISNDFFFTRTVERQVRALANRMMFSSSSLRPLEKRTGGADSDGQGPKPLQANRGRDVPLTLQTTG